MLIAQLNSQPFEIVNDWHDLTLNTAVKIYEMEIPDVQDLDDWHKHAAVMDSVLLLMTNFKREDLEMLHPAHKHMLFTYYCLPFVQDIKSGEPKTYKPQGITSFRHNGKTYLMPETLDISGFEVLQYKTEARQFVEASQLLKMFAEMKTEGLRVWAAFAATVVKETKGEYYNEEAAAKRTSEMQDLPMDIFWELFFCTLQHTIRSVSVSLKYMLHGVDQVKAKKPTSGIGFWALLKLEWRARWKALREYQFGNLLKF
jgi:hypothetical protein